MKYIISILSAAFVMWGVMAFITLLPNPADWTEINRVICAILWMWFSVAACSAIRGAEE